MERAFVLLCSAVVIRLIGGLATIAQFHALWLYPLSAWASWLAPLAAFELSQLRRRPAAQVEDLYQPMGASPRFSRAAKENRTPGTAR
jgi:hypothetical protein